MKNDSSYDDLARIFSYPWDKEPLESSLTRLSEQGLEPLQELASFVKTAPLGALQEEYVARFDFSPRCAPYLGYHLYGEHQLRGEYLVRLKELYRAEAFELPQGEPPDHLAVLLRFASHLEEKAGKGAPGGFVQEYLLDGMRRLHEAAEAQEGFPWKGAVAAALAVCEEQCREVKKCSTPSSS